MKGMTMPQEAYPCAGCDVLTTRINYAHELPSCSRECDELLDAVNYITPADEKENPDHE